MGRFDGFAPEANQAPTMLHFSHPHPLELCNFQNQSEDPKTVISCSGCKLQLSGTVYACRACNFILHSACALLPQLITHPCHPSHTLVLLPTSSYPGGRFNCDACNRQGDGFSYHCQLCDYDLHVICASKPLKISHQMHPCQLELSFENPYKGTNGFSCDVCSRMGYKQWLYRCSACEFDVHLGCANASREKMAVQHQPVMQQSISLPGAGFRNQFQVPAGAVMSPQSQNLFQPPVPAGQVLGSVMPNHLLNISSPMGHYQSPQGNQLIHGTSTGSMLNYQPTFGNQPIQNASAGKMQNYQPPIGNQFTQSASTGSMMNYQPPIVENNQASMADGLVNAAMQGLVEGKGQAVGQNLMQSSTAGGDGGNDAQN